MIFIDGGGFSGYVSTEETKKTEPVEVDLDDVVFMKIAIMAHERDITFNQMCNRILEDYVDEQQTKVE